MYSTPTMYVQQSTDGGETYATRLGDYAVANGLCAVTFSTEDGFDGEFMFKPSEHWLEHVPRREPDKNGGGNIEYWYSKNADKYFADILCTQEISLNDTYLDQNTYTLTFEANGGTGVTLPMTGLYSSSEVILPASGFSRVGHTFYGWSDGSVTYLAGSLFTVTGDQTLTAKWHQNGDAMCHVTFHKNADDATGVMDDQTCNPGDVIRLHANEFVREGWTFYGWSTTGSWDDFLWWDQSRFDLSTDIDLYALWLKDYVIKYDANAEGVTGTMGPQKHEVSRLNDGSWYVHQERLIPNTYERDGYRFTYWYLNPECTGRSFTDGGVSPIDELRASDGEIKLYAGWERNKFTVTFDKNADDAEGEMEPQIFTLGMSSLLNENRFTRPGYRFKEWNTAPDGSGTRHVGYATPQFNKDTTLYAVWQKTCTVTFMANGGEGVMEPQKLNNNVATPLNENQFTREGYTFAGWNTNSTSIYASYSDGAEISMSSDATLYAIWKRNVKITYDANGGYGTMEQQEIPIMPAENTTVSAAFISDAAISDALDSVNGSATSEIGKSEAQISITVDETTAQTVKAAAEAVNVTLTAEGSKSITDDEKASAVEALSQAGLIVVESDGDNFSVKRVDGADAEIRVVEKTYLKVEVKDYWQNGDRFAMTFDITPMKQTVATVEAAGTQLSSENSVPFSTEQAVDVTEMTEVTVGIPSEMAQVAGGAGKTVYVQHTHNGKTYEYPAVIGGNDTDGYTATFDNPNGFSEFTVNVQSNTVASYENNGVTYRYTAFAEAIADALDKNVTAITMYKMPSGEDFATVKKIFTFTFSAADGCESLVDLDMIYTDWLLEDDGIVKASDAEQLAEHQMRFNTNS